MGIARLPPKLENPVLVFPVLENPEQENPAQLNTNIIKNKDLLNTEESNPILSATAKERIGWDETGMGMRGKLPTFCLLSSTALSLSENVGIRVEKG